LVLDRARPHTRAGGDPGLRL